MQIGSKNQTVWETQQGVKLQQFDQGEENDFWLELSAWESISRYMLFQITVFNLIANTPTFFHPCFINFVYSHWVIFGGFLTFWRNQLMRWVHMLWEGYLPWQSSILTSQNLPEYPEWQSQVKLLMPSWQTPLLHSDGEVQSLILVSQSFPV